MLNPAPEPATASFTKSIQPCSRQRFRPDARWPLRRGPENPKPPRVPSVLPLLALPSREMSLAPLRCAAAASPSCDSVESPQRMRRVLHHRRDRGEQPLVVGQHEFGSRRIVAHRSVLIGEDHQLKTTKCNLKVSDLRRRPAARRRRLPAIRTIIHSVDSQMNIVLRLATKQTRTSRTCIAIPACRTARRA